VGEQPTTLLSVVVPCYNERQVIALTHRTLVDVLGTGLPFALEIIYVDDGSSDGTGVALAALATADDRISVVSFARNFGHQSAVTAGLEQARGDMVAVIDADMQDPPAVIIAMIARMSEGYDVVYGVRRKRKEHFLKKMSYRIFYRMLNHVADIDMPLDSGDFCLLRRNVVEVLRLLPEKNRFMRGLRAWCGFRQVGLEYERAARAAGETKYPLRKLMKLAFDGIFNFSTKPLSYIFGLGVATSLLAAFALIFFLLWRVIDFKIFGYAPSDVPGFTSVILSILFFSGIQLVSLGIIGEYMGRMYQEIKGRPVYIAAAIHRSRYGERAASIGAGMHG
jgi:glycosyltransferase involved in cell wall biosynthesis